MSERSGPGGDGDTVAAGEPVLVFGAGGHGAVVIECIEADPARSVAGIVDDDGDLHDANRSGYVVRPLDGWTSDAAVVVAIGDNAARERVAARIAAAGRPIAAPIVHPRATVSPRARIGAGTVVLAGAVVNARAVVGAQGIVNTAAVIEHDCVVGETAHIGPGAVVAGAARIGARAQIGAGAVVLPGVDVGSDAVVGAGAVVTRPVPDGTVAVGVPARVIRPAR